VGEFSFLALLSVTMGVGLDFKCMHEKTSLVPVTFVVPQNVCSAFLRSRMVPDIQNQHLEGDYGNRCDHVNQETTLCINLFVVTLPVER